MRGVSSFFNKQDMMSLDCQVTPYTGAPVVLFNYMHEVLFGYYSFFPMYYLVSGLT